MTRTITLDITGPTDGPNPVEGFRSLWAHYVNGYDPTRHCQDCFHGRWVGEFSGGRARTDTTYEFDRMDEFPYLYICGVASGPAHLRGERNLHLPLAHALGEEVTVTTYNGYTFRVRDAARLATPHLPTGWEGKPEHHTRCRNFRFAVAHFGYPPGSAAPATHITGR